MTISRPCSFNLDEKSTGLGHGPSQDRDMNKSIRDELITTGGKQKVNLSRYKVLVVDDEAQMRELIVKLLSLLGHQCITAGSGLEALEKAEEEKIDAVVTDIVMPEMDGIVLTRELSKKRYRLPIMIITGHSKEYSEESALAAGAREFIRKPFSIEEFLLRFRKMMRDHEAVVQMEARTSRMIFNLHQECSEKVKELEREVGKFKGRLYSSYFGCGDQ